MTAHTPRTTLAVTAVATLAAALAAVPSAAPATGAGPRSDCYDASLPTTVEESRLSVRTAPDQEPASDQLLRAGGFDRYADDFDRRLCRATTLAAAKREAARHGTRLWRTAVDRAQGRRPDLGTIDAYDDRPLYWAHLRATRALRQWAPDGVSLTAAQRSDAGHLVRRERPAASPAPGSPAATTSPGSWSAASTRTRWRPSPVAPTPPASRRCSSTGCATRPRAAPSRSRRWSSPSRGAASTPASSRTPSAPTCAPARRSAPT